MSGAFNVTAGITRRAVLLAAGGATVAWAAARHRRGVTVGALCASATGHVVVPTMSGQITVGGNGPARAPGRMNPPVITHV